MMLQSISGWLTWLLTTTGPPVLVVGLLAFVFREKWRQILSRSMSSELERLKHELALAQADHAASLAPQLEAKRHDFQKELESYKTSLIAQAEEVKLKTDLKKSLGSRYLEVKFTRLMLLEEELARCGTTLQYLVAYDANIRTPDQLPTAISLLESFGAALGKCQMFLTVAERQVLANARDAMGRMLNNVGPNAEIIAVNNPQGLDLMRVRLAAEELVRGKIHLLAGQ